MQSIHYQTNEKTPVYQQDVQRSRINPTPPPTPTPLGRSWVWAKGKKTPNLRIIAHWCGFTSPKPSNWCRWFDKNIDRLSGRQTEIQTGGQIGCQAGRLLEKDCQPETGRLSDEISRTRASHRYAPWLDYMPNVNNVNLGKSRWLPHF